MNFFQRRAILKKANFLDLTPVRIINEEIDSDNIVTLLIPKFTSNFGIKYLQPKIKSPYIKMKLDELGSASWQAIDSKKKVSELIEELEVKFGKKIEPAAERFTKFLTILYDQKIIAYKEIIGD
jgi:hypothetical protein